MVANEALSETITHLSNSRGFRGALQTLYILKGESYVEITYA